MFLGKLRLQNGNFVNFHAMSYRMPILKIADYELWNANFINLRTTEYNLQAMRQRL